MLKFKLLIWLALFSSTLFGTGETVRVGLYYKQAIPAVTVKIQRGNYQLYADGNWIKQLKKQDHFSIVSQGTVNDSLELKIGAQTITAQEIKMTGLDYVNHFTLNTPVNGTHAYDDDLLFTRYYSAIRIINETGIENYVSAVVEGEAGYKLPAEFYKLQAILSRTYALKNYDRHAQEGFSVCDKVHCQVYHQSCHYSWYEPLGGIGGAG